MADEKMVEVELLDGATTIDGERYERGDKIVVAESVFKNWQRFGSARKWGQNDKASGDTKARRVSEGEAEKSRDAALAEADQSASESPQAQQQQSGQKPAGQRR